MLLLGFYKDLLASRYSLTDLLIILCFIHYSVLSNYTDDKNLLVIGKNKEGIKILLLLDFEVSGIDSLFD